MKRSLLFLFAFLFAGTILAQEQLLNVAKQYLNKGDYEKAAATYKQLYEYQPDDPNIVKEYIQSLIGLKDYKNAEKLLKTKIKHDESDNIYTYELAKVYVKLEDNKKANKLFDKIIDQVPNSQETIKAVASRFERDGYFDYAISTYEKGKKADKDNIFLFAEELAVLYDKKGDNEKATESLLDLYASAPNKSEEVKAAFQRMMNKPEKMDALKKRILKRISSQPDNVTYPDLLSWIFIQQKDYESAFQQVKAIDTRLGESGRRVLGFARVALREKEFNAALLAYKHIIDKGRDQAYYNTACSERLTTLKLQLQANPNYTSSDVDAVCKEYATFLEENPNYKQKETLREYAELEARYAHRLDKAIALLSEITSANNVDKAFRGTCKLEQGDYELIRNNIWESTLLYSQVDKEFKQDVLGEEARFRNAKLSYYIGDFLWAQGQLDVLKASTSELIANDALNLSVLITENNPPADSNTTPLLMFARAELLSFQNKTEEALNTLDSISVLFPKHPLQDNILMQRATIAYKKHDYNEAAAQLQKIVLQHGNDILADDALYNLAYINEVFFENKDEAKRLYEELLLKHPGSTFVNEARKRFRVLRGDKPDVDTSTSF